METEKRLLSAKEAAVYLGLSHRTLWAWAQQGIITVVRLGRRVLFDREDLDKMIEDCTEWSENQGQDED
jgi:excisionase family DNA binding protein